jgi:hypothetical protein
MVDSSLDRLGGNRLVLDRCFKLERVPPCDLTLFFAIVELGFMDI